MFDVKLTFSIGLKRKAIFSFVMFDVPNSRQRQNLIGHMETYRGFRFFAA
jgi:hypothetical protein